ncbi:MAG: hypothetical protein M1292_14325, partial [Bacteroidetes bacterium]|nr:hypothetical protein [Bacteroidota bacterium]
FLAINKEFAFHWSCVMNVQRYKLRYKLKQTQHHLQVLRRSAGQTHCPQGRRSTTGRIDRLLFFKMDKPAGLGCKRRVAGVVFFLKSEFFLLSYYFFTQCHSNFMNNTVAVVLSFPKHHQW